MEKKIEVIGDIEVGGERGRVLSPKTCASSLTSTDYKDPQKTIKRVDYMSNVITMPETRQDKTRQDKTRQDKIIVLGGLGVSARRDRDPDRVLYRKGIIYALPAHISTDKPLVVRKYR